jgi:UDP-N-acetylglucosamine 2-epimerase (non-hydrolysing)
MVPIMKKLQDRAIEYNFVFIPQHRETILEILQDFGLKKPDYILCDEGKDIVRTTHMFVWSLKVLFSGFINRHHIFKHDQDGVVLVHGDAPPLLLGSILAKTQNLKVASVEAGLRSFNFFKPFPEEATRVISAKLGLIDIFYCQDLVSESNAKKYNKRTINTQGNTIIDTIQLANGINKSSTESNVGHEKPYIVVSLHRFETISNVTGLNKIAQLVKTLSKFMLVKFILHPPTREALTKSGLYDDLIDHHNIELIPRMTFLEFNKLISNTEFMVTDGGSNQEECAFLGIPCLIIRNETERKDGIGNNAILSYFDQAATEHFIHNYGELRQPIHRPNASPSDIIIDDILDHQQFIKTYQSL